MAGLNVEEQLDVIDPDFSTSTVPDEARMDKGALTMAWWALCSAMFYLVFAATLALNYGASNAIVGMAAAIVVFTLIGVITTRFCIRTGMSVAVFSQLLFGRFGGRFAIILLFLVAIYYAVFEGSVIAVAIQRYFPVLEVWHAYLIVVAYSIPLVFGGISRWLDKFNGYLLPFYALGLFVAVGLALTEYGYSNAWLSLGPDGGTLDGRWWSCFTSFMAIWVLMMYTMDYARFGKREDEKYHEKLTFGLPFYACTFFINGVIGIFLVATIDMQEALSEITIVFAILKLMGFWGLLFIWISQTRINTANFQVATVNMQNFLTQVTGKRVSKVLTAIIVGIIVFLIMLTDIFSFILEALSFQAIFIVAWAGLALPAMISLMRKDYTKDQYRQLLGKQSLMGFPGVVIWCISSGCGLFVLYALPDLTAFASPTAVLISFVGFYVWLKFMNMNSVLNNFGGEVSRM